jgi:hypothetical protein
MKNLAKLFPHYFPLLGIFIAGIVGFSIFLYDKTFQIIIASAIAVAYVVWGVIHHLIKKDLYLSVVVEYMVVATLGLVILFSIIFRG